MRRGMLSHIVFPVNVSLTRVFLPCAAKLIFAAEYTQAEGANWHMNHFCCWLCDTPLAGKQYTPVDEQPHCLDCYQKKYGKV